MKHYIVKRLLVLIPVMLIVSILAFSLTRIMPGGAAMAYLRAANIPPTAEAIAHANEVLGLNRPLFQQYAEWFQNAIHWDFGVSYLNRNMSVTEEINAALGKTMLLTFLASVWALLIGIPLGLGAARKPNGKFDHFSRAFSFITASMPHFLTGLLLITLFSQVLKILPSYGARSFKHYIMPSLTLGLGFVTYNSRILRNSLLENKNFQYALYARARGLSEKKIMNTHIMRNSLIPQVTLLCLNLGHMLGGSILVENIFSIPGMGSLIMSAINDRDYPIIQGWIVVMAIIFLVINLAADIMCALINPQARYE